jgi:hypothetical protein
MVMLECCLPALQHDSEIYQVEVRWRASLAAMPCALLGNGGLSWLRLVWRVAQPSAGTRYAFAVGAVADTAWNQFNMCVYSCNACCH